MDEIGRWAKLDLSRSFFSRSLLLLELSLTAAVNAIKKSGKKGESLRKFC